MFKRNGLLGIFVLICVFGIILPSFSGCALFKQEKLYTFEFFDYFDTVSSFKIYGEKKEIEFVKKELEALLYEYDAFLDIYDTHGDTVNLYDVNREAKNGAIAIRKDLFDVLSFGKEMHALTGGECNIALGSVISLWHTAREVAIEDPAKAYIPSQDELDEALKHTDISSVVLDPETLSVSILDPQLYLDCGAIAKGYVAQIVAQILDTHRFESYLINLGGNVLAKGIKDNGELWSAAIEDATKKSESGMLCKLKLDSQTLVTSGSYQRFYTFNGKNYSHIVSQHDGMPPETFISVSVLAPSDRSGTADALSTALFCMSLEDGKALVNSLEGIEALWVTPDGSKHTSAQFEVESWE